MIINNSISHNIYDRNNLCLIYNFDQLLGTKLSYKLNNKIDPITKN